MLLNSCNSGYSFNKIDYANCLIKRYSIPVLISFKSHFFTKTNFVRNIYLTQIDFTSSSESGPSPNGLPVIRVVSTTFTSALVGLQHPPVIPKLCKDSIWIINTDIHILDNPSFIKTFLCLLRFFQACKLLLREAELILVSKNEFLNYRVKYFGVSFCKFY